MSLVLANRFPYVFRSDAGYKERMPASSRAALFDALSDMQASRPDWLPLIRPESMPQTLCQYAFVGEDFGKYSGKELLFIRRDALCYHRLPGALPDGAGEVAPGVHRLRLRPFDGAQALIANVEVANEGGVRRIELIPEDGVRSGAAAAAAVDVPCRMFAYSVFLPELLALVSAWTRRLSEPFP